MNFSRTLFCIPVFLLCVSVVSALELGENAPEPLVEKWIKGGPVSIKDGKDKNIFVIEFWATWCPPCRISIPHLSDLQKEYADKAVIFAGISKEKEDVVAAFVKLQGNMDYNVGIDNDGKTTASYMGNESGIPMCFLIGKEGKLLWKGHPMDIGRVLKNAVEGTFDISKEKKISALHLKMQTAMQAQNSEEIKKLSNDIIDIDPSDELAIKTMIFYFENNNELAKSIDFLSDIQKKNPRNMQVYVLKLDLMNQLGMSYTEIKGECEKAYLALKNDYSALNALSLVILDRMNFGSAPIKIALDSSKRALELLPPDMKSGKRVPFHSTLARAYYSVGRVDLAVAEQEKAAKLAAGLVPDEKVTLELLDYYKEALKLGSAL